MNGGPAPARARPERHDAAPVRTAAVLIAAALTLSACVEIDWHRTGQLWLGSLCDGASQCSYDSDGDPYTRW